MMHNFLHCTCTRAVCIYSKKIRFNLYCLWDEHKRAHDQWCTLAHHCALFTTYMTRNTTRRRRRARCIYLMNNTLVWHTLTRRTAHHHRDKPHMHTRYMHAPTYMHICDARTSQRPRAITGCANDERTCVRLGCRAHIIFPYSVYVGRKTRVAVAGCELNGVLRVRWKDIATSDYTIA